jgi:hypothetical protein
MGTSFVSFTMSFWAILVVASASELLSSEKERIVASLQTSPKMMDIFNGKQIQISKIRVAKSRVAGGPSEIEKSTIRYSQLSPSIWRAEVFVKNEKKEEVPEGLFIRDENFIFSAAPSEPSGPYGYQALGFDAHAVERITNSMHIRTQLEESSANILEFPLKEFFSHESVEVVACVVQHSGDESVELITFLYDGTVHGAVELDLSPVPKVRKLFWNTDAASTSGAKLQLDVEYKSIDGKEYPSKVIRTVGTTKITAELLSLSEANPDRNFYKAESVGLVTPPAPKPVWLIWLAGGVLISAAGFALYRYPGRTSRSR